MDPTYPLVPVVNIFFAFLLLLLLPWRLNSWSIALQIYTIWLTVLCLCRGVNSIIWKDNVDDIAPIWCDIGEAYVFPISELQGWLNHFLHESSLANIQRCVNSNSFKLFRCNSKTLLNNMCWKICNVGNGGKEGLYASFTLSQRLCRDAEKCSLTSS